MQAAGARLAADQLGCVICIKCITVSRYLGLKHHPRLSLVYLIWSITLQSSKPGAMSMLLSERIYSNPHRDKDRLRKSHSGSSTCNRFARPCAGWYIYILSTCVFVRHE